MTVATRVTVWFAFGEFEEKATIDVTLVAVTAAVAGETDRERAPPALLAVSATAIVCPTSPGPRV